MLNKNINQEIRDNNFTKIVHLYKMIHMDEK